jgi:protein-S-isoprenylcysteine O-methyltransferase Ste14
MSGCSCSSPASVPCAVQEPTSSLVVEGPYRCTRNPIYLGFRFCYGKITALVNSPPSALLLPFVLIVIQRGVIEREERYLELIFGEEYLRYKARFRNRSASCG